MLKPIFAKKYYYSLESSWRDLSDLHASFGRKELNYMRPFGVKNRNWQWDLSFALLRSQKVSKFSSRMLAMFHIFSREVAHLNYEFFAIFVAILAWPNFVSAVRTRFCRNFTDIELIFQKILPKCDAENLKKIAKKKCPGVRFELDFTETVSQKSVLTQK